MNKFARMSPAIPPSVKAFLDKKKQIQKHQAERAQQKPAQRTASKSKVEKLVEKRQKALLAARDTLTKIIHSKPDLLSASSAAGPASVQLSARDRRIARNIAYIKSLDTKIAPLPGLHFKTARPGVRGKRGRAKHAPAPASAEEKGVRLLAERLAARRAQQRAKMLHEADLKQHQLLAARKKLI